MFLKSLNNQEKEHFLSLVAAVIEADGVVEEVELQLLGEYADEMDIPICDIKEKRNIDLEIQYFVENSDERTKRKIFVELLALAYETGEIFEEEKELIQKIAKSFGIEQGQIDRVIHLKDVYVSAYMSLTNFIEKGE